MSFLKNWEPFTLLLLRCGLGSVFIYHGYPSEARNAGESLQAVGLPGYFVFVAGVVEFLWWLGHRTWPLYAGWFCWRIVSATFHQLANSGMGGA